MKAVYLDHCTSAFPKAPGVGEAMARTILRPGRAEGSPAAVGEKLLKLAHAPAGSVLRFTPGADWGLGWLLSALLRPGDRVLASPMERGSVLRALEGCPGVTVELMPCTRQGELILDGLEEKLTPDVKAVVLTHASHVSGDLFPMAAVGALCRARDICFLADGAQTFGVLPVDMAGWGVDGLVFPGHTGLLGPEGMGGLALSPRLAALLPPFPDDSLNLPGIAGLGAALDYLEEEGERLTVRLGRTERPGYYIDYCTTLRCAGSNPVTLEAYRYGGFCLRTRPDWNGQTSEMLTSEGAVRDSADGSHARWCYLQGPAGTGYASLLVVPSADNLNYPEPLRVWPSTANPPAGDVMWNFSVYAYSFVSSYLIGIL